MWRFIGLRYSLDRYSDHLLAFLSRLSTAGLVLGVALLIVVLSVMNGFDREMRERILSLVPHVTIMPWSAEEDWNALAKTVQRHPGVASVSPFLELQAMLVKGRALEPALVYGVSAAHESKTAGLQRFVDLNRLAVADDNVLPVILGSGLAETLGVEEGDRLNLLLPASAASADSVRFQRVQLVQVLRSGTEVDQRLVLMDLYAAKALSAQTVAIGLRLSLEDVFAARAVAWELRNNIGYHYQFNDWTSQLGNLYQAIQMSRKLVVIMLLAVVAVAVFNIVSTLVMVVHEKESDIAILRSLGAPPAQIVYSFMLYGAVIGAIGVAMGGGLGALLSLFITDLVAALELLLGIQFLQSDVYPISYLPSDLRWPDVLTVCGVSYGICLVATLYPAWRASKVQPAEVLSYR
ncbi:MAG TPA: lipoprotein-releasing ABC transporter permease subunit [Spongiibacteraceae bacterium]|nr:lipoprotein-releasing ABC transporter permease subunit [Spongiibacteraceae bacterium]